MKFPDVIRLVSPRTVRTGSVYKGLPQLGELRHGFARGGDVLDLDAGDRQTQNRSCRGHPVILVAMERAPVQWSRTDDDSVNGFFGITTEPVDLGYQGSESIRFMAAQMRNTGEYRWGLRQGADSGHRWRELAGVGEFSTGDGGAAANHQRGITGEFDVGTKEGKDGAPFLAHLGSARGPVRYADSSACRQGSGKERPSVGQVGLDTYVEGTDPSGCNAPVIRHGVIDVYADVPQGAHCHRDVVKAGYRFPDVLKVQAFCEAGTYE